MRDLIRLNRPIEILVDEQTDAKKQFHFSEEGQYAVIPSMKDVAGIAIGLHELGHAKQYEQPFFGAAATFVKKYRINRFLPAELRLSLEDPRDFLKSLLVFLPEAEATLPDEKLMDTLVDIYHEALPHLQQDQQRRDLQSRISSLQQILTEDEDYKLSPFDFYPRSTVKLSDQDLEIAEQAAEQAYAQAMETEKQKKRDAVVELPIRQTELNDVYARLRTSESSYVQLSRRFNSLAAPLNDILKIPTKLQERDATKRAFQWMNQIYQEMGSDLLSRSVVIDPDVKERFFKTRDDCSDSTKRVMDDIHRFGGFSAKGLLLGALGTYDALDKIPVPSLKRLEQIERDEEAKQKSIA